MLKQALISQLFYFMLVYVDNITTMGSRAAVAAGCRFIAFSR